MNTCAIVLLLPQNVLRSIQILVDHKQTPESLDLNKVNFVTNLGAVATALTHDTPLYEVPLFTIPHICRKLKIRACNY